MTEKTENKTERQELSETIDEILELITEEVIQDFNKLAKDYYYENIDFLTNVKKLLKCINSYLIEYDIRLETMLKQNQYNSNNYNIYSNERQLIEFNNYLKEHLQDNRVSKLKQAIISKDIRCLNWACQDISKEAVNFAHNILIPSLQIPSFMYLQITKLLNNMLSSEQSYIENLQKHSDSLSKHVETKLQETNKLIAKIEQTEKRVNDLTDIAIGKASGEIYTKMARKQVRASNWFRGFAIATTIGAFIVAFFGYFYIDTHQDISPYAYLHVPMLVTIISGLATYLARQGARHRSMFEKYNFLSFKHSSFNMYIDKIVQKNLDSKEFDKSYELLKQFIDDREVQQ